MSQLPTEQSRRSQRLAQRTTMDQDPNLNGHLNNQHAAPTQPTTNVNTNVPPPPGLQYPGGNQNHFNAQYFGPPRSTDGSNHSQQTGSHSSNIQHQQGVSNTNRQESVAPPPAFQSYAPGFGMAANHFARQIQGLSNDVSILQRAMHTMTTDFRTIQTDNQNIRHETNSKFDQLIAMLEHQGDSASLARSEPSALSTDLSNETVQDGNTNNIPATVIQQHAPAPASAPAPAPAPATAPTTIAPALAQTSAAPAPAPPAAPAQASPAKAVKHVTQTSASTDAKFLKAIIDNIAEKDLTLPSFNGKKSKFEVWYMDVLTTMRTNSQFKSFVTTVHGIRTLSSKIDPDQNEKLYKALTSSLSEQVKTQINFFDYTEIMDGEAILLKLQEEYGLVLKDKTKRQELAGQLKDVHRQPNESLKAYHIRYVQKFKECQANDCLLFNKTSEYYGAYLTGTGEKCLHDHITEICLESDRGKAWLALPHFNQVRDKAELIIDINAKFNKSTGTPTPSDTSTTSKTTQSTTGNKSTKFTSRKAEIRERMKVAKSDIAGKGALTQFFKRYRHGCYLHNTSDHAIFDCNEVENICKATDREESYKLFRTERKKYSQKTSEIKEIQAKAKRAKARTLSRKKKANSAMAIELKAVKAKLAKSQLEHKQLKAKKKKKSTTTTNVNQYDALQEDDEAEDEQVDTDESEIELSEDDAEEDSLAESIIEEMVDHELEEDNSDNNSNTDHTYLTVYTPISILRSPSSRSQRIPTPSRVTFASTIAPTILAKCNRVTKSTKRSRVLVTDSGCTHHMDNTKSNFEYIIPITDSEGQKYQVEQGDGSHIQIEGMGPVTRCLDGNNVRTMNLFVPNLACALFSIKQHIKSKGCYFHAESNHATLAFPTFHIPVNCDPEMGVTYHAPNTDKIVFNEDTAPQVMEDGTKFEAKIARKSYIQALKAPTVAASKLAEPVFFTKRSEEASVPVRQSDGSVGYDITSIQNIMIQPGATERVKTGLSCAIPKGMYMRIASRSSLASKGLNVQGGVIDNDYRGEIMVLLHNCTTDPIFVSQHQRVAQLIFEKVSLPCITLTDCLSSTARNKGGFGSTNKNPNQRQRATTKRKIGIVQVPIPSTLDPHATAFVHVQKATNSTPQIIRRISLPLSTGVQHPSQDPTSSPELTSTDDEPAQQKLPSGAPFKIPREQPSPRVRPIEKVNSTTSKQVQKTIDNISQSIGFLKPEKLLRNLKDLGTGSVTVSGLSRNPKDDAGETASIRQPRKTKEKTAPKVPEHFSDCFHMDIGFGPCTAIGGVRYTLLLVDKHSRYKFVYPLRDLKGSIVKAMKKFLKDVKVKPKLIRTDFDFKLMGGKVLELLDDRGIDIETAPPSRQDQNGLVERHWQTIVQMARNWMRSSLLPSTFWWYAIKRAVEVTNILPTSHLNRNKPSTPFEIVFNKKVDYRVLFPMFCTARVRRDKMVGGDHKNKWVGRSMHCILVGTDHKSDGLLFYHPATKHTYVANNGFRFNTYMPAGPTFGYQYDGNFTWNTKAATMQPHMPMAHEDNDTVFCKVNGEYKESKVLASPFDDEIETYTVQVVDTGDIIELTPPEIHTTNPEATPSDDPTDATIPIAMLPWIKHKAKATLYLNHMTGPKQGRLMCDKDEWTFIPGRSTASSVNKAIALPEFLDLAQSMVTNKRLFQGWRTRATVLTARFARATSNIMARHVSAKDLKVMEAPSLLRHHQLHPEDRETWDAAYSEEYNGLMALNTWEVITEPEYRRLIKVTGRALPTMAISTIKKDENGKPKRAKYRIVVLGNHDPNDWSKTDCFAPVLSQPELRLLVSIATDLKCIPKCGDVSQAFCQGVLPDNESYVIRPPPGCPHTPKGSYWRLLRTLYGLKRSPRHWYEKAKATLKDLGIVQLDNSPCVFKSTPIPGKPPIYIGLYVDDFIYFSESDEVEKSFETEWGKRFKTTFDGDVSHFLGITFHTDTHKDGHISIHMNQEPFTDSLCQMTKLDGPEAYTVPTPYRSGYPVDKIPYVPTDKHTQSRITFKMQKLVGCLQWLCTSTRPDIATITNLLAQHTHKASKGHLDAVKRVVRYLKGTKSMGIAFHSRVNSNLSSFVKFPIDPQTTTPFTDANWGPQDQSKPKPNDPPLELFKSRSLSGFIIWTNGPLHWMSKRQTITARSSAEAEIYATDECVKYLIYLRQLFTDLKLNKHFMKGPTRIYNDNAACVQWAVNLTTKGLRHIQMRENAVREEVQKKLVKILHIPGKYNISDMFTKEDKDVKHFTSIRDMVLEPLPSGRPTSIFK